MKVTIGTLELTRFTDEDSGDLYRIRNHSSIRRYMADSSPISYKAHNKWVRENLIEEPKILLFMARRKKEALAFTLLKKVAADTAEMGVIFKEASKHPVLASYCAAATLYVAFSRLNLDWLISYVVTKHEKAFAMNRTFGGWEIESDKPGMIKFCVNREICTGNQNYVKILERIKDRLKITGENTLPF